MTDKKPKPWRKLWRDIEEYHEEKHAFCEVWDCGECLERYNESVFEQGKLAGKKELVELLEKDFKQIELNANRHAEHQYVVVGVAFNELTKLEQEIYLMGEFTGIRDFISLEVLAKLKFQIKEEAKK